MEFEVVEDGEAGGREMLEKLVVRLTGEGYTKAVIAKNLTFITYWAAVRVAGEKLMYYGTPEDFARWREQQPRRMVQ